jgi:DNA modification methylase
LPRIRHRPHPLAEAPAAAELTERVCYGIELDPKYVDVVIQRWQQLTGKQATLDGRTFAEIAQERRDRSE